MLSVAKWIDGHPHASSASFKMFMNGVARVARECFNLTFEQLLDPIASPEHRRVLGSTGETTTDVTDLVTPDTDGQIPLFPEPPRANAGNSKSSASKHIGSYKPQSVPKASRSSKTSRDSTLDMQKSIARATRSSDGVHRTVLDGFHGIPTRDQDRIA